MRISLFTALKEFQRFISQLINSKYFIFFISFFLFFYFFLYGIIITWDSAHYVSYLPILTREMPFGTWDIVRGPVFPILIHISNLLFGKTSTGLLMMSFIWYIVMLFFLYLLIQILLSYVSVKIGKKLKQVITICLLFLVIINPIVYGYYHTLLTEYVAASLAIVSCYLSIKYLLTDVQIEKKKYILYVFLFSILAIFAWFLKQPYVGVVLFPFLISSVLAVINKFNIKNILYRLLPIIISFLLLFVTIFVWNYLLESKKIEELNGESAAFHMNLKFISGIDHMKIQNLKSGDPIIIEENNVSPDTINKSLLSNDEKKLLLENPDEYFIIEVYNNNWDKVDEELVKLSNGSITTNSSLKFLLTELKKYPSLVLDSYYASYMTIANIFAYEYDGREGKPNFYINRVVDLNYSRQNKEIAYKLFYGDENIFYLPPFLRAGVDTYYQVNNPSPIVNSIMKILGVIYEYIFKINFVLLPFTLLISIIYKLYVLIKRKRSIFLDSLIILLGYSFLHLLVHAILGSGLDRYGFPAFITTFIGNIFFFYLLFILIRKKTYEFKTGKK